MWRSGWERLCLSLVALVALGDVGHKVCLLWLFRWLFPSPAERCRTVRGCASKREAPGMK